MDSRLDYNEKVLAVKIKAKTDHHYLFREYNYLDGFSVFPWDMCMHIAFHSSYLRTCKSSHNIMNS